ncbi:MAG: PDZ domain-containing protein, partial [Candidatus Bipolaricaulota bacterium]
MHQLRRLSIGIAVLTAIAGCTSSSGPEAAGLPQLVDRLLGAATEVDRAAAIEEILATGAPVEELSSLLREGRTYAADVSRGWRVLEPEAVEGVSRPFHLYVPESYDPETAHAVLFDLHGAVVGPGFAVGAFTERRRMWEDTAARESMLLLMPHGDREAHWWNEAGHANLLGQLRYLKRNYNIDENRVFLSGFSDGGSGALWMAFHDPTPWAGFISLHGNPTIPDVGPYPCYPRNLLNRPIRATNGARDALYPAGEIRPLIDQMLLLGVDIRWTVYDVGHDLSFFLTEEAFSAAFLRTVTRDPSRPRVLWETADPAVGRCDWVQIDEIGDVGDNAPFDEVNFWRLEGSLEFGVGVGATSEAGVTVAGVVPGTVAHLAGVRRDDILTRIGERAIDSSSDVREALRGVEPGESLTIEVLRDGERLVLEGQVPGLDPVYRRPGETATIEVSANDNRIEVAARHVARYTLLISAAMFDLDRPIVVVTNGTSSFDGVVVPDPRFLL